MIDALLADTGLTANALAELAGMPASTVQAIRKGSSSPRWSTLQSIATAAGYDLELRAEPVQDSSVIELFVALGEGSTPPPEASRWQSLLDRMRGDSLEAILRLIGLHARIEERGGVKCKSPANMFTALGVVDGAVGRHRWLVSGADALVAAGLDPVTVPRIVYSDHLVETQKALGVANGDAESWLLPMTEQVWDTRKVLSPAERYVSVYRALGDAASACPESVRTLAGQWMEKRNVGV